MVVPATRAAAIASTSAAAPCGRTVSATAFADTKIIRLGEWESDTAVLGRSPSSPSELQGSWSAWPPSYGNARREHLEEAIILPIESDAEIHRIIIALTAALGTLGHWI